MPSAALKRTLISRAVAIRGWRFWLSVVGIATCALLVLSLVAALRSATFAIANYVRSSKADIWVAPAGTDNLVRTSAFLPLGTERAIEGIAGVAKVDPVTVGFVTVKRLESGARPDRGLTFLGVGYRAPAGMGGPPRIVAGAAPSGTDEVALDRAAARRLGVNVGDKLSIGGRSVSLVGLSDLTNLAIIHMLFANYDTASSAGGYVEQASFLLVRASAGTDVRALAASIRTQLPDVQVIEQWQFIENCSDEAASQFLPILALVNILGVATAAALVALLVHGLAEERRAELAALLALGASERHLWMAVGWQGLRLALTGAAVGLAGAVALGRALDEVYPVLPVSFAAIDAAGVALLFAAAGVVASSIPVLRLRRLDPMEAFRP